MMYYKPTPLFRADVREIAHGLIIRTIWYIKSAKFELKVVVAVNVHKHVLIVESTLSCRSTINYANHIRVRSIMRKLSNDLIKLTCTSLRL